MKAIRQVLHYIKGTKDYGITYKHNGGNKIHGYSDSSYEVNTQEGKGTAGIIFYYGESPISWSTQKQAIVALSSCESKFIAAATAATQALWLKRLLSKLTHFEEYKVTIRVDNKSAIVLMKNPVFHERSKHIDTKYHFIRECVEREDIQVEFVNGEYQEADILTKALPKIRFLTMRQLIGLKNLRTNMRNEVAAMPSVNYGNQNASSKRGGIMGRLRCGNRAMSPPCERGDGGAGSDSRCRGRGRGRGGERGEKVFVEDLNADLEKCHPRDIQDLEKYHPQGIV
nr:ribonuclease H-like domain, reverse transcriptase, RNA-dependent DNA polymerase [Tanacetum cinerariifolium]